MTREEAIRHLENIIIFSYQDGYTDEAREALKMAIADLKAEPCEDAVSREAALKAIEGKEYKFQVYEAIEKLPPVTPKPTECEDAVKREAVLNTLDTMDKALDEDRTVEAYKELLKECYKELPPVTPKQESEE